MINKLDLNNLYNNKDMYEFVIKKLYEDDKKITKISKYFNYKNKIHENVKNIYYKKQHLYTNIILERSIRLANLFDNLILSLNIKYTKKEEIKMAKNILNFYSPNSNIYDVKLEYNLIKLLNNDIMIYSPTIKNFINIYLEVLKVDIIENNKLIKEVVFQEIDENNDPIYIKKFIKEDDIDEIINEEMYINTLSDENNYISKIDELISITCLESSMYKYSRGLCAAVILIIYNKIYNEEIVDVDVLKNIIKNVCKENIETAEQCEYDIYNTYLLENNNMLKINNLDEYLNKIKFKTETNEKNESPEMYPFFSVNDKYCNKSRKGDLIGSGAYATVHNDNKNNKIATKHFINEGDNVKEYLSSYDLDSRFILKPIEIGKKCLSFDLKYVDLYKYIKIVKNIDEELIKSYIAQLILAVYTCHINCIAHLDIKTKNILIDKKGLLFLTDFGIASKIDLPVDFKFLKSNIISSPPEMLLNNKGIVIINPFAIDIWAIGVVFLEMINGGNIFTTDLNTNISILNTVEQNGWKHIIPKITSAQENFVKMFLKYNPSKRATVNQVLQHKYIRDYVKKLRTI